MKTVMKFSLLFLSVILITVTSGLSQDIGTTNASDIANILPERERAEIMNEWLEWRLENIVPELMRREGIDMWLVICREYNEDPVYMSMVPEPGMAARRTSILIFHDLGADKGVVRRTGSFYGMGKWYAPVWNDKSIDQFDNLANYIKEHDPKKIGIDESDTFGFGDGLSASHKARLVKSLGKKYSGRLVSAENLCVGWLERRSPQELSVYRHITGIAHDIIREFFSNKIIVPGITTTDEVVWWIRQKITGLGLETWFQPSIDIQRRPEIAKDFPAENKVIIRGDLLHCDIGIVYLGLCTDTQNMAYVCQIGEDDAPAGLKKAMKNGNRVQDIFMSEFGIGKTGNEVFLTALKKAKAEGLIPSIYTHPLGVHGHAAGTTLGMWDKQDGVPGGGDYPLHYNTCYAIELNNQSHVPEWDGGLVRISLEEGGVFTKDGCKFIDGRQENLYLIK